MGREAMLGDAAAVEPAMKPRLGFRQRTSSDAESAAVGLYRRFSLMIVVAALLVAVLLFLVTDVAFDPAGMGMAMLLLAVTTAGTLCRWTNPWLRRVGDACGMMGLTWTMALAGGFISLLGLRLRLPLADDALLRADRWLGVDGPQWIAAFLTRADWPAMVTMSYNHTVPVLTLSLAAQALAGCRAEAWRAAFCFAASLLTVCLVSILTPARGLGMWLTDATLAQLPGGAARYFWPSFDRFYSGGGDAVLTLAAIDGVVSFPSFHTVMGLITLGLWRHSPIGFGLALAWFVQMMAGTMPLGGHYFVDLLGGLGVWALWFAVSRRVERQH